MSEWITDRRPTAEDGDNVDRVWVCDGGEVYRVFWGLAAKNRSIWQPITTPEPYVEPKRKRRCGWLDSTLIPAIETFDDDPDFDELIAAAQEVVKDHTNGMNEIHPQNVQRLNEALKPRSEK